MSAQNAAGLTPEPASRAEARQASILARRPVVSFFVLAYALSWLG